MNVSQISAPCIICGRPASQHGEHHFRPHDVSQGKGSGGTHEHLETVVICREHHQMLHDKTLVMSLDEGIWRYRLPSGEGMRPAVIDDGADAVDAWSDEHLAAMWADGEDLGAQGFIQQARAAYAFRTRYGWADSWYTHAARLIRESTGRAVSTGAVYERAQFGLLLKSVPSLDPLDLVETFGRKTGASIGRAIESGREGEAVIEQAIELVNRMSKTQARRVLDGVQKQQTCEDTQMHKCRWCGEEYPDA